MKRVKITAVKKDFNKDVAEHRETGRLIRCE